MNKQAIDAIDMVRRIRDVHYERLRHMSPEEQIAFYHARALQMQAESAARSQESPAVEGRAA